MNYTVETLKNDTENKLFDFEKLTLDNDNESPYSYSKYEFFTENSMDIKNSFIQYAESVIDRPENQITLNKILNDIDTAIKIELGIFEYALVYCHNNRFDYKFIKPVYDDKFNNILINIKNTPGINNTTFKKEILKKNINPSYCAFMSPSQIHPKNGNTLLKKRI